MDKFNMAAGMERGLKLNAEFFRKSCLTIFVNLKRIVGGGLDGVGWMRGRRPSES